MRIWNKTVWGMFTIALLSTGCTENKTTGTTANTKARQSNATGAGVGGSGNGDPLQQYHARRAKERQELISLPVQPHWKQQRSPKFDVVYMGDPGDVYYVRRGWGELPAMDDIDAVRDFYREACIKETGGIISVDVQKVQGRDAIVYYSKQLVKGIRGYRFVARCVLPVGDGWQEVRMGAIQMGITGARASVASITFMQQLKADGKEVEYEEVPENAMPTPGGPPKPGSTRIKGYCFDPYDPAHNDRAMNSIADDVKFDKGLPKHPLSRVRRLFPKLLEEISLPE